MLLSLFSFQSISHVCAVKQKVMCSTTIEYYAQERGDLPSIDGSHPNKAASTWIWRFKMTSSILIKAKALYCRLVLQNIIGKFLETSKKLR